MDLCVSKDSSKDMAVKYRERLASMVLPEPGGPIISTALQPLHLHGPFDFCLPFYFRKRHPIFWEPFDFTVYSPE